MHVLPVSAQSGNTPPFTAIELDLSAASGLLNRTLPFDVPFFLEGAVPAAVTAIDAARAPMAPSDDCRQLDSDDWTDSPQWRASSPVSPANGPRRFSLLFQPLNVNALYCFRFTTTRELPIPDLAQFRDDAITTLDTALRRLLPQPRVTSPLEIVYSVNLSTNDTLRIGTSLRNSVLQRFRNSAPQVGDAEDLRVTSNTLLDLADTAAAHDRLQSFLSDVADAQELIYDSVGNLNTTTTQVVQSLDGLLQNPLANDIEESLPTQAEQDAPVITAFVERLNLLRSAAQEGGSQDLRDVLGLAPLLRLDSGFLNPPPESFWTTVTVDGLCTVPGIDTRIAQLTTTMAAFREVVPLIGEEAIGTLALDDAERQNLAAEFRRQVRVSSDHMETARYELTGFVNEGVCGRRRALEQAADNVRLEVATNARMIGTTIADFITRSRRHFSADIGLAVAQMGEIFPYIGVNIYCRPVNREAALTGPYGVGSRGRRASFMLGVAWTDNLVRDDQRAGVFSSGHSLVETLGGTSDVMLVVGGGYRVTDAIRVNGGLLVFKAHDVNPLSSRKNLDGSPFVSMSWDWDVVGSLRGLFGGDTASVLRANR